MSEAFDPITQANEIGLAIKDDISEKYAKGQLEHGGNFFNKPTIQNIREEVIDLVSYTHVLAIHKSVLATKLQQLRTHLESRKMTDESAIRQVTKLQEIAENL